ncbi:MAG TPA: hypothetical protein VEL07_22270 [Planctomycetota bacterium]|nr:hypothetical protein [Planctomycetota bacterium]
MRALRAILLISALTATVSTLSAASWDEIVTGLRDGTATGPFAIYLGCADNRLPRLIADGAIDTAGVVFAVVPAAGTVRSPISDRPIPGARLHAFFAATAGTVIFLDVDGLPIPQLSIPQAMHGDDAELFSAYFGYVAGGHHRAMSIAEYCRALGKEQAIVRAVKRVQSGFSGRELKPGEAVLTARNHLTGETVDPNANPGVFHVYSSDPRGRVFLAQIAEIHRAFAALDPQITLIVPDGDEPPLDALPDGIRPVLAHASRAAIESHGPSPHIVVSGGGEPARGVRLDGFQPADALARLIGLPLTDLSLVDRDIPYAEVDAPAAPPATAER